MNLLLARGNKMEAWDGEWSAAAHIVGTPLDLAALASRTGIRSAEPVEVISSAPIAAFLNASGIRSV